LIKLLIDGFFVGEITGFSTNEIRWENEKINLKKIEGKIEKITPSDDYSFYFNKSRNQKFEIEEEFLTGENKIVRKFLGVRLIDEKGPIQIYSKMDDLEWDAEKINYRIEKIGG